MDSTILWQSILVAVISSSGVWGFLQYLFQKIGAGNKAVRKMLLGLGHDRLYTLCNKYIDRGWISTDELENLAYIYEPYKDLGGNGTGERLYERVCGLPNHDPERQGDHETD